MKGAGTDAQVFLQIYGEKGKSDEIKLENNSDSFEQAQLDKFMVSWLPNPSSDEVIFTSAGSVLHLYGDRLQIEMPDLGRLLKLRIWHEKRHPFSGWHLAKVRVYSATNLFMLLDKLIALIIRMRVSPTATTLCRSLC